MTPPPPTPAGLRQRIFGNFILHCSLKFKVMADVNPLFDKINHGGVQPVGFFLLSFQTIASYGRSITVVLILSSDVC